MKIKNILILSLACLLVGCGRPDFVYHEVSVSSKSQNEVQKQRQTAHYVLKFSERGGVRYYSKSDFEFPEDFAEVGQRIVISNKTMFAVD
jgi:hypothetical protein